jgi:hypothetical protein
VLPLIGRDREALALKVEKALLSLFMLSETVILSPALFVRRSALIVVRIFLFGLQDRSCFCREAERLANGVDEEINCLQRHGQLVPQLVVALWVGMIAVEPEGATTAHKARVFKSGLQILV